MTEETTNIVQKNLLDYQSRQTLRIYQDIYGRDQNYQDLNLQFIPHPISGALSVYKDVQSVSKALVNLVLTEPGEKLFQPTFGTPLGRLLFELNTLNPLDLESIIEASIKRWEPRAKVEKIVIENYVDRYSIEVSIYFSVISIGPEVFSVQLKRTR